MTLNQKFLATFLSLNPCRTVGQVNGVLDHISHSSGDTTKNSSDDAASINNLTNDSRDVEATAKVVEALAEWETIVISISFEDPLPAY